MGEFYQRLRACPPLVDPEALEADPKACQLVVESLAFYPIVPVSKVGCPPPPEPVSALYAYLSLADHRTDLEEDERQDLRAYLNEQHAFHHAMWRLEVQKCATSPTPGEQPEVAPDEHFKPLAPSATGQILEMPLGQAQLVRDRLREDSRMLKSYALEGFPGSQTHIVVQTGPGLPADDWLGRAERAGKVILMEIGAPGELTPGGSSYRRFLTTRDPFVVAGSGKSGFAVIGGNAAIIAEARRGAILRPPKKGGFGLGALLIGAAGFFMMKKRAA